ncbi:hypothetical protein GQ55_9G594100 [Panicum hallii var. hallii]|uniref:Uncharacterized protein n=1 Tax=Panicum hallii var. hallii TaxID=1504633 RepID=A0A2T7CGX7_9POAL|nr:hypothetical protein GQ55_9G594100 [Panicum hallii var. hallii]
MPTFAPGIRPANAHFSPAKPLQPIKFSDDTERLQHINSVRKSTVGALMKLVIDLLYKVMNNPKVKLDGRHFSYKPVHVLTGRDQLHSLIKKQLDGIVVEEVKDAYPFVGLGGCFPPPGWRIPPTPSILEDLQALKASGDVWWLSGTNSQEDTTHFNDPRYRITVDIDLKQLFRGIELPRDMLDIEKELKKIDEKPSTDTAKRRALAEISGAASKSKARKKQRGITSRTRLTNRHPPELFENLST